MAGIVLLYIILIVVAVVAYWKVFEKAGKPGWYAVIPFLNTFTLFEIAGRNGWMFLLLFIPIVNIVVLFMLSLDIAKAFGKDTVFAIVALFLFSFIGYLILGFGDAKYAGVTAESTAAPKGPVASV